MVGSLYLHIPFCHKKCIYCDFYSIKYQKDIAFSYIDVLIRQLRELKGNFYTIYIGGGTPTVLDKTLWQKLFEALGNLSRGCCEFTIEANPESLNEDKLRLFRDKGVNRISLGLQSLGDDKLKKLGRLHTKKEAIAKIFRAKEIGFNNINIDLIFGVWGQSLKAWKEELKEAVTLPVTHLSVYSLTPEKNTPFFKKLKKKELEPLAEEIVSDMYKYSLNYLPRRGFPQYEVSNFSKKNYQCRHNLNYWNNGYYLGLGSSAVSYLEGVRKRFACDVNEYIKKAERPETAISSKEKLTPHQRAKETAALKIRTVEGINLRWFKLKTGFDFLELESEALKSLNRQGLLKYKKGRRVISNISLTKKGFLFSDAVSRAFL